MIHDSVKVSHGKLVVASLHQVALPSYLHESAMLQVLIVLQHSKASSVCNVTTFNLLLAA